VGIHTAAFMKVARHLYERSGFVRCPRYDLLVSDIFTVDRASGDEQLVACRLDL